VGRVWAYHTIAALVVLSLWYLGWLSTVTALAFATVVLKASFILWQQNWYRTTKIQQIAMLETTSALIFAAIVCLSLLPAHL
jgi:TRAP-type C4-dicarboxylate transport system permease small subunit